MIQQLTIKGYRSVRDANVPLGPLRILIGPNASGKSNIIDALRLLADAVRTDVDAALIRRGDLKTAFFHGPNESSSQFELVLDYWEPAPKTGVEAERFTYRLRIGEVGDQAEVLLEELISPLESGVSHRWFQLREGHGPVFYDGGNGTSKDYAFTDEGTLALKWLGSLAAFPHVGFLRRWVENWRFLTTDVARIREPQRERRETVLAEDGSNLLNVLRTLEERDRSAFEKIVQDLRGLVAQISEVETFSRGGQTLLKVQEQGLPLSLDVNDLSEGTLRLLTLLTAVHTMQTKSLLCIEEPEQGLHPLLFGPLLELFRERCPEGGSRQILLTSHSPDLIDAAEPGEVLTVERNAEGETQVRLLDVERVDQWLREFRLGELWRMRQIGGVPA